MHALLQRIATVVLIGIIVFQISIASALTNKEAFLASLETVRSSIAQSVTDREKLLSDRAAAFGAQYDAALKAQGYSLDEIEALTRIPKLNAPNFRRDVSEAYAARKAEIFSGVQSVSA